MQEYGMKWNESNIKAKLEKPSTIKQIGGEFAIKLYTN